MKLLHLNRGMTCKVSNEDYEELRKYNWKVHDDGKGKQYVRRTVYKDGKRTYVYMHRQITDCPPEYLVDHRNCDGLDNQRGNLRIATSRNNAHNCTPWGEIPYRGVGYDKKSSRYRVRISESPDCQDIHMGFYKTAEDAAHAYDAAAVVLFGPFAWLNFPVPYIDIPEPVVQDIPF